MHRTLQIINLSGCEQWSVFPVNDARIKWVRIYLYPLRRGKHTSVLKEIKIHDPMSEKTKPYTLGERVIKRRCVLKYTK